MKGGYWDLFWNKFDTIIKRQISQCQCGWGASSCSGCLGRSSKSISRGNEHRNMRISSPARSCVCCTYAWPVLPALPLWPGVSISLLWGGECMHVLCSAPPLAVDFAGPNGNNSKNTAWSAALRLHRAWRLVVLRPTYSKRMQWPPVTPWWLRIIIIK